MNSLNILSGRSPTPPAPSRSRRSSSYGGTSLERTDENAGRLDEEQQLRGEDTFEKELDQATAASSSAMDFTESSPLLASTELFSEMKSGSSWRSLPNRITTAVIGTTRVIFTTITVPARYVIACFYDENDQFSPFLPIITICRVFSPRRRKRTAQALDAGSEKTRLPKPRSQKKSKRSASVASTSTAVTSDSELDEKHSNERDSPARNTRSRTTPLDQDEIAPQRRSIRIKLHNEESLKQRRRDQQEAKSKALTDSKVSDAKDVVAAALKSPSSPGSSSKLTKFPRAPAPPRPLVPRRQPSYSKTPLNGPPRQKTLIIDLDETLIHSHSKGGRFATGHMVEVKIGHTVGVGGVTFGPQVPILYYVHKRPHCDEFLRKVCSQLSIQLLFSQSMLKLDVGP
jgi:CTD nuclear envelope phosphatase 1